MVMAKSKKSEDVPQVMEAKFNSIVELTNDFAQQHLNDEYAQLIRQATAALCRKRPSPLDKGQVKTWACGITHAIGMVNFLFDRSQSPHVSSKDLYQWFGVAESTGQGKSKQVRDTLKMRQFDPDWCLPSKVDSNPLIWMLSVNGFMMDIRQAPLGAQVEAYRKGLIPYIPGHRENSDMIANVVAGMAARNPSQRETRSAKSTKQTADSSPSPEALQALYVLEVAIIDGPMTEEFIQKNRQIVRTIEIQGEHTLADLHKMIFKAFDRVEEHLYEFQLKGEGPNDPNADRYGLAMGMSDEFERGMAGDVTKTKIGALDLSVGEPFGYWFDFGDDWWHQVSVREMTKPQSKVKYPRITDRTGASPP
jgi:Domain of unknown function (DUF6398)/Plasmid pRiA4b ORF-3-like protein